MEGDHPDRGGGDGLVCEDESPVETDQWAKRKGRHDSTRITLNDSEDEEDRKNMTGNFYHGRNRHYSGSYDNVYEESTVV